MNGRDGSGGDAGDAVLLKMRIGGDECYPLNLEPHSKHTFKWIGVMSRLCACYQCVGGGFRREAWRYRDGARNGLQPRPYAKLHGQFRAFLKPTLSASASLLK